MGALTAQCQYAVMHIYAYKNLPTPQDEKCFVARNAVGCRMYMQIQGTALSVYLLECTLLAKFTPATPVIAPSTIRLSWTRIHRLQCS